MHRVIWLVLLTACAAEPVKPGPRDEKMVASDKELEAKIVYMLENDREVPELRQRNIKVECVKGCATLSGTVFSPREKERAGYIADMCAREVQNHLTVKSGN
jgi:osmotically-inducible protein OsmY